VSSVGRQKSLNGDGTTAVTHRHQHTHTHTSTRKRTDDGNVPTAILKLAAGSRRRRDATGHNRRAGGGSKVLSSSSSVAAGRSRDRCIASVRGRGSGVPGVGVSSRVTRLWFAAVGNPSTGGGARATCSGLRGRHRS